MGLKQRFKKSSWGPFLRLGWYVGASILVLSLPTFSFLVPELKREERLVLVNDSVPDQSQKVEQAEPATSVSGSSGASASFKKPAENSARSPRLAAIRARTNSQTAVSQNRLLPVRTSSVKAPSLPSREGDAVPLQRRTRLASAVPEELMIDDRSGRITGRIFGSQVSSDTDAMERGYQLALLNLFEDNALKPGLATGGGNPFQDALDQQKQNNNDGGPEPPSQQPPPPHNEPPATPPPNSGNPPEPDPTAHMPGGNDSNGEIPEVLSFLIIGEFNGQESTKRAARHGTGEFVLEDGGRVSLFSGTFGIPRAQFLFEPQDKFVIGDLNGDGVADLVRATRAHFGTVLETHVRTDSRFELRARSLLPYQNIGCMTLFGRGSDGFPQLALVVNGNPNLIFLSVTPTEFRYSRELSLPLVPALLADVSLQGPYDERRLYILGSSLNRGYYLSSRFPESLLFSWNPLPSQFRSYEIEATPENPSEFHTLRINQRMLLFQQLPGGINFLAGIDMGSGLPMILLGDFLEAGHWQMVYFP